MMPERNGAGGSIVVRGFDSSVPDRDIAADESVPRITVFVSHNQGSAQLDERGLELDIRLRSDGDDALRLDGNVAFHLGRQGVSVSVVPDFRPVFVLVVGDLLFLPRAGDSLRVRRAKVCALLFSLP